MFTPDHIFITVTLICFQYGDKWMNDYQWLYVWCISKITSITISTIFLHFAFTPHPPPPPIHVYAFTLRTGSLQTGIMFRYTLQYFHGHSSITSITISTIFLHFDFHPPPPHPCLCIYVNDRLPENRYYVSIHSPIFSWPLFWLDYQYTGNLAIRGPPFNLQGGEGLEFFF